MRTFDLPTSAANDSAFIISLLESCCKKILLECAWENSLLKPWHWVTPKWINNNKLDIISEIRCIILIPHFFPDKVQKMPDSSVWQNERNARTPLAPHDTVIKATLLTLIMTSLININLSNTQHAIIKRSFYIEKALITHSLKVHRVNSKHSLLKHLILILES